MSFGYIFVYVLSNPLGLEWASLPGKCRGKINGMNHSLSCWVLGHN